MPLPRLKGRKPFAIVLLHLKNVPIPDSPLSRFQDFATPSEKGGLYDYSRGVSNNVIYGSEMYG